MIIGDGDLDAGWIGDPNGLCDCLLTHTPSNNCYTLFRRLWRIHVLHVTICASCKSAIVLDGRQVCENRFRMLMNVMVGAQISNRRPLPGGTSCRVFECDTLLARRQGHDT